MNKDHIEAINTENTKLAGDMAIQLRNINEQYFIMNVKAESY